MDPTANVIYKDKKPISFEKAYLKSNVKLELMGEKEHSHGFVKPFSRHQIFTWIFLTSNFVF